MGLVKIQIDLLSFVPPLLLACLVGGQLRIEAFELGHQGHLLLLHSILFCKHLLYLKAFVCGSL